MTVLVYVNTRKQVGDPDRVIDVALAAGNIADVCSIREHKLEPALQNVPDRLPVDACRLHRHVRDAVTGAVRCSSNWSTREFFQDKRNLAPV